MHLFNWQDHREHHHHTHGMGVLPSAMTDDYQRRCGTSWKQSAFLTRLANPRKEIPSPTSTLRWSISPLISDFVPSAAGALGHAVSTCP